MHPGVVVTERVEYSSVEVTEKVTGVEKQTD